MNSRGSHIETAAEIRPGVLAGSLHVSYFNDLAFVQFGAAMVRSLSDIVSAQREAVPNIFNVGTPLQVFQSVVELVKVFVVNFWTIRIETDKCDKNKPVNSCVNLFGPINQIHNSVSVFTNRTLQRPLGFTPLPFFPTHISHITDRIERFKSSHRKPYFVIHLPIRDIKLRSVK